MSKIKKIFILSLFTPMILTTICFANTASVTTEGVRVRKEPSTEAEIVTILNTGAKVDIQEQTDEWYKVKYQDYEGYMFKDYLKLDQENNINKEEIENTEKEENDEEEEENIKEDDEQKDLDNEKQYPQEITTVSEMKVYITPSITSSQIGNFEKGKDITVNCTLNDWSYVQGDNIAGWVRNYYLEKVTEKTIDKIEEYNETASELKEGYVNSDSVNLREAPNTNSNILTTLILNTKVTIVGENEEWYKVEYQNYKGYIAARLISKEKTVEESITTSRNQTESRQNDNNLVAIEKTAYVKVDAANIRAEANTNAKILTVLKKKAEIKITGEVEGFYKININNQEGYISKTLVAENINEIKEEQTTNQGVAVTNTNSETMSAQQVVDFAMQFVGYPYVYGGTTPSGFDCSGFVYYVYNSCGYKLSRSCPVQANSGIAVTKNELQPGDIVFFNHTSTDGSISHVGMYIGNGTFIHASNATRGVVTDTLTSGTYCNYFHSARRIIY